MLPRRPFRLDHGRRQPAQLPSLAEMARARGGRPARPKPLCGGRRRRAGAGALPPARGGGEDAARPHAARLGVPAWTKVAPVVDRAAGAAPAIIKPTENRANISRFGTAAPLKPLTGRAYLRAASCFAGTR